MEYAISYSTVVANIRPMIPLRLVANDSNSFPILDPVLADTGAHGIVLPDSFLDDLGCDTQQTSSLIWRGSRYDQRVGRVKLQLEDDAGYIIEWRATVYFSSAPLPFPIFGQRDGLEHFNHRFKPIARKLLLEKLHTFPGRIYRP